MVTFRHTILLILTAFSPLCSQKLTAFQAEQAEQATKDIYSEFEYLMASLGSATYTLVNTKESTQYHQYLETKKPNAEIIDALGAQFYGRDGYQKVAFAFKQSPTNGIDEAITLLKKIAGIVNINLPSTTAFVVDDEKIAWLKQSSSLIEKQYKSLKPTIKADGWPTYLKRALLLNIVTRNWNWSEFSQLGAQIMPLIGLGSIMTDFAKKTNDDKSNTQSNSSLDKAIAKNLAMCFGTMVVNSYLGSLEGTKKALKKKDEFLEKEKMIEENKKIVHTLISHPGKGPGFERIEGIQNETTLDELHFYSKWLKKPLSFAGNRFAIMLYGEPGNGKGIISKALAEQSNTPMINITADDIKNGNLGIKLWGAEHIAQKRKEKSVIVLFDEIDEIIKMDKTVKHALLTLFDGAGSINPHIRILFVCATNHINEIDSRILRPGRFKTKIHVGPPSDSQRQNLIESTMHSLFQVAPAELVSLLVQETQGLSRVAIVEALENTYNHAISISMAPDKENFMREIKKIKDVEYHSSQQIA